MAGEDCGNLSCPFVKYTLTRNPLVSIVVPTFNGSKYLRNSIESILAQDYPHIELLVFDDGSCDDTQQILEQYGKEFFWESHENIGQSATLNKGWRQASGEILSYLSVDDVLISSAVGQAVNALQKHPDAIVVYGDYDLIDESGRPFRRILAPDFDYRRLIAEFDVQPGPGAFFRREVFDLTGGWNQHLKQTPDFDFWLKAGLLGNFYHVSETWAQFRVHSGSQTYTEASPEKADEYIIAIENFYAQIKLPTEIRALRKRALAMAHTVSARAHIRSGRFSDAINHLRHAYFIDKHILLRTRAWKMILSGIRYRIDKLRKSR